jgi:hypothetical protein
MIYFAAYGLTRLIRDRTLPAVAGLNKFSLAGKFRWLQLVPIGGSILLVANLPFFFYDRTYEEIARSPTFPARDSALLNTSSVHPAAKDLKEVCHWLRQNGDEGNRRVFFQNTLGNARLRWRDISDAEGDDSFLNIITYEDTTTHFTHLPAMCGVLTGMPQIGSWVGGNLFPIERISISESGMLLGSPIEDFDDAKVVTKKRILQRLNISHVVTCEHRLRTRLSASRYFTHKKTFGQFDIFEFPDILYVHQQPGWAHFSRPSRHVPNNRIEVTRFRHQAIDIVFENYATLIDLHVAVCHHPFWKATVDDKRIRVESDDLGLMKIPLEVKDEKGRIRSLMGRHKLRLQYLPQRGASVPTSIASLAVCIILLLIPTSEQATQATDEDRPSLTNESQAAAP